MNHFRVDAWLRHVAAGMINQGFFTDYVGVILTGGWGQRKQLHNEA